VRVFTGGLPTRNKAVSDGAVSFYLDHHVRSRISKVCYGVKSVRAYNEWNPEHRERQHLQYRDAAGIIRIPNGFEAILPKVCVSNLLRNEQTVC